MGEKNFHNLPSAGSMYQPLLVYIEMHISSHWPAHEIKTLTWVRSPDKHTYEIIYLIFQPKHMSWVPKRTVSMRGFFWTPKNTCLDWCVRKWLQFNIQIFFIWACIEVLYLAWIILFLFFVYVSTNRDGSGMTRVPTSTGKPGKSKKNVPCMEKSWNLKKLKNHGKIMEFCEIICLFDCLFSGYWWFKFLLLF